MESLLKLNSEKIPSSHDCRFRGDVAIVWSTRVQMNDFCFVVCTDCGTDGLATHVKEDVVILRAVANVRMLYSRLSKHHRCNIDRSGCTVRNQFPKRFRRVKPSAMSTFVVLRHDSHSTTSPTKYPPIKMCISESWNYFTGR